MFCRRIILALFWILAIYILPLESEQVWGDVDTLRPVGDRAYSQWTVHPSGNDWEAIDEVTPNEDTDYLWSKDTAGTTIKQGWYHSHFTAADPDSVKLTLRAKSESNSGTRQAVMGRKYDLGEGYWGWCIYGEGTDTVSLTNSYADYSITWTSDPYDNTPWTQAKLNSTSRCWAFDNYKVGDFADTVLEDDFNDNSLDGNKWIERHKGGNSEAREQNENMELVLDHSAHCGAGIYTKSTYNKSAIWILEVDFRINWDYDRSTANYGYDGIWILRGDTSGTDFWDEYYGSPTTGLFVRLSSGCGMDNDGVGIYYDDDLGFECSWDTTVAQNTTFDIDTGITYAVKLKFGGSSGLCSLWVDSDLKCSGTLGSNWLNDLGNAIRFQMHQSYYNTSVKLDQYDNFRLIQENAPLAPNRVTQSFIEVFYQAGVEVLTRQGGIAQDEDNRGIAEGGVAR